jgi:hypothetical protein
MLTLLLACDDVGPATLRLRVGAPSEVVELAAALRVELRSGSGADPETWPVRRSDEQAVEVWPVELSLAGDDGRPWRARLTAVDARGYSVGDAEVSGVFGVGSRTQGVTLRKAFVDAASIGMPYDLDVQLAERVATGGVLASPHHVEILNADNGSRLEPPVEAISAPVSGKVILEAIPYGVVAWIHVRGEGPSDDPASTYDSLALAAPHAGDNLVLAGTVGFASSEMTAGGFDARPDRVGVSGQVYRVDGSGRRVGSVGCVELWLDDIPSPAVSSDQRYVAPTGLPTPLAQQTRTLRSGKWYFGNVAPGKHSFKVTVDRGQTFLKLAHGTDELTLFIPFARKDAASAYKDMYVHVGLDVPGPDLTPADCPIP